MKNIVVACLALLGAGSLRPVFCHPDHSVQGHEFKWYGGFVSIFRPPEFADFSRVTREMTNKDAKPKVLKIIKDNPVNVSK